MKHKSIKKITIGVVVITLMSGISVYAELNSQFVPKTAGAETVLASVNDTVKEEMPEINSTNTIFVSAGAAAILDATTTEETTTSEKAWGYTNLGIANVENHLNIRAIPAEDGKLVGKLPKNAACEIISTENGWAHIQSGAVDGYVATDFLLIGMNALSRAREVITTMATVTTDTLKVRDQPNTQCEVITLIPQGEELEVVGVSDGWVEVMLDDETAYVASEFVSVEEKLNTAVTMTELLYGEGVSDVCVDLCQYAKEFVGNSYVWGGTSLTSGADCSGFVLSIFKKYGISLPHSAKAQAGYGTKVSVAEAKPGDLFFYAKGGSINHVAIYIGGGQVVHASSPSTGIRISNATYRTPAAVRRLLTTE